MERSENMTNIEDIEYITYQVTDLGVLERFLVDFGLTTGVRTESSLYMRAASDSHHVYIGELGDDNRFICAALRARSMADLELLARQGFASDVEDINAPGGGKRVRLAGPDGHRIDVVYGMERLKKLPVREPLLHNYGTKKVRLNASQRPPKGSPDILRLGHFTLTVRNAVTAAEWFCKYLNMRPSDYLCVPNDRSKIVGVFLHFDHGKEYVDHHSLLVVESPIIHIHHVSFEVQDVDAVHSGHNHLLEKGYKLDVGVGRHMAGSQIFDYWWDPFGHRIEHYADGDIVNSDREAGYIEADPVGVTQWGPIPPDTFFN